MTALLQRLPILMLGMYFIIHLPWGTVGDHPQSSLPPQRMVTCTHTGIQDPHARCRWMFENRLRCRLYSLGVVHQAKKWP